MYSAVECHRDRTRRYWVGVYHGTRVGKQLGNRIGLGVCHLDVNAVEYHSIRVVPHWVGSHQSASAGQQLRNRVVAFDRYPNIGAIEAHRMRYGFGHSEASQASTGLLVVLKLNR